MLAGIPGISFQNEPDERYFSNHWLTTILIDPGQAGGVTREDIYTDLARLDIETRPLWKPMHLQPVFANVPAYTDGTSERLFRNGLCLPSSSNITDGERKAVVDAIRNILKH
jgi:dTDP-4-amino-4,6-dideoxygalactose transaminase